MTLIVTFISKHGIIHASDSNISFKDTTQNQEGKKVFQINFLNAGLCVAGAYSVGGERMDTWMPKFIETQSSISDLDLFNFSNNLKNELEEKMSKSESEKGSLIQIAGYVEKSGIAHPEFWFVRNIYGINQVTGNYEDCRRNFQISEDYWQRDSQSGEKFRSLQLDSKKYQIYFNGFPPGRIAFNYLREILTSLFNEIWSNETWKFRPPENIEETEEFVKIQLQMISLLFNLSNYESKAIGGKIQSISISQPENIFS